MQFELAWHVPAEPGRAQPRLRIQPSDSPIPPTPRSAPVEYDLQACSRPRCNCTNVELRTRRTADGEPPEPSGFPTKVWLDLETVSLVRESGSQSSPAFAQFEQILRTQIRDAALRRLREWFFAEKVELIETGPIEEIDIQDLPDASRSQMIGFLEIFPCALAFCFDFEGETWAMSDQACVQIRCECSETVLSFFKLEGIPRAAPLGNASVAPSLRYNYRTHQLAPVADWPATRPAPEDLLEALRASNPKLDEHLELRHTILKALYSRKELERLRALLVSLPASVRPKIGRNDPCPCGSGRKFKHCCLNKPGPVR